jgi:hypothetical protein
MRGRGSSGGGFGQSCESWQGLEGDAGEVGDAVGLCGGPDGRMYFITPTEIQIGPTIMFER